MRVLVTGGAGFIGSHLVDQLVELGHEVRVLDNYSTGNPLNLMRAHLRGVRTTVGSVVSPVDADEVVSRFRPEVVFHLAAQIDVRQSVTDPGGDARTNIVGTIQMLEACRAWGVRRFVLASSAAVYGHVGGTVSEGTPYRPISPYGASKAAAEAYANMYQRGAVLAGAAAPDPAAAIRSALQCTTVLLSNVYGPRQREEFGAVNLFARRLLKGEPVTLYGDGGNVRDYVFVADAVRAFLWAGDCLIGDGKERPERVLVGTGRGTTDAELMSMVAREVAEQTGRTGPGQPDPMMAGETLPARPEDIRRMVFPNLGMCGTILDHGIRVTVQELRKEMGL